MEARRAGETYEGRNESSATRRSRYRRERRNKLSWKRIARTRYATLEARATACAMFMRLQR